MPLTDLVAPNAIIPALKVNGKKQTLQELAAKAKQIRRDIINETTTAGSGHPTT